MAFFALHYRFILLIVSMLELDPEATGAAWSDAKLYAALSLLNIALWTTRVRMDAMVIGRHASMHFSFSFFSIPFLYIPFLNLISRSCT